MSSDEPVAKIRFDRPRDILDAIAAALNSKDAGSLGRLFTEDAEFINVRGMRMHGRQGIIEGHALAFSGPLAGSTFEFDSISELTVTADVMVVHAHTVRDRLPDASATTGPKVSTVLQVVARRGPEGWLAVAVANVPESPPLVHRELTDPVPDRRVGVVMPTRPQNQAL
jgi:uncharacterized protein (TIGR02246 family)